MIEAYWQFYDSGLHIFCSKNCTVHLWTSLVLPWFSHQTKLLVDVKLQRAIQISKSLFFVKWRFEPLGDYIRIKFVYGRNTVLLHFLSSLGFRSEFPIYVIFLIFFLLNSNSPQSKKLKTNGFHPLTTFWEVSVWLQELYSHALSVNLSRSIRFLPYPSACIDPSTPTNLCCNYCQSCKITCSHDIHVVRKDEKW